MHGSSFHLPKWFCASLAHVTSLPHQCAARLLVDGQQAPGGLLECVISGASRGDEGAAGYCLQGLQDALSGCRGPALVGASSVCAQRATWAPPCPCGLPCLPCESALPWRLGCA
jgi:hypothetical protein